MSMNRRKFFSILAGGYSEDCDLHRERTVMREATIKMYPSGKHVNLLRPRMSQIDIRDIAHHLAFLPRYLGGTAKPYNNAQHSWFVCSQAAPELKLACLLHDAAESYTGDLPGQLKHLPGMEFYRDIQDGLQNVIFEKHGLSWTPEIHDYIHALEKHLYEWEEYLVGRDILPDWDDMPNMETIWPAALSEQRFLAQFHALYKGPESEFA